MFAGETRLLVIKRPRDIRMSVYGIINEIISTYPPPPLGDEYLKSSVKAIYHERNTFGTFSKILDHNHCNGYIRVLDSTTQGRFYQ